VSRRHSAAAPSAVRAALADLFGCALAALAPERLLARVIRDGRRGALVLTPPRGRAVTLPLRRGLVLVGAGKGAASLAAALETRLGPALTGGVVIVPPGYARPLARVAIALGGHPVPDLRSARATRRVLAALDRAPDAAVLVVVTGGASSLLAAPARGLTLADKSRVTALLLASGATIDEMNAVRKHLSAVKGGRLAERLAGRPAAALVVSDVPGDDLAVIGSGPTAGDLTTFADARRVLAAYGLTARIPPAVRVHLARGAAGRVPETPKPGAPAVRRVPTVLLAGNATARAAVARAARHAGWRTVRNVRRPLRGPTDRAARDFAARIVRCQARLRGALPALVVAGGETTVALGAAPGRGGRNQEFALEVARALAGRRGWALLSAGTDGIDGPTAAAGAFADGSTAVRARGALARALARHDAYPLLRSLGDLLVTGPTGTNVADLKLALVWRSEGWRLPDGVIKADAVP
jgi:glycerate 2-kinase